MSMRKKAALILISYCLHTPAILEKAAGQKDIEAVIIGIYP
jgi:hypothetical protein